MCRSQIFIVSAVKCKIICVVAICLTIIKDTLNTLLLNQKNMNSKFETLDDTHPKPLAWICHIPFIQANQKRPNQTHPNQPNQPTKKLSNQDNPNQNNNNNNNNTNHQDNPNQNNNNNNNNTNHQANANQNNNNNNNNQRKFS